METMRNKNYCFTSFKDDPPVWDATFMQYLVFQRETSPETGRLHWQGYMECQYQIRHKTLVERCPYYKDVHFGPRRGTAVQARKYCMKDESRVIDTEPMEYGVFTGRTTYADKQKLVDAVKLIRDGGRLTEVDPMVLVNKHRGLTFLKSLSVPNRPKPVIYWFYGPTDTGKTTYAKRMFDDYYMKDQTKWWDSYNDNEVVIINELRMGTTWSYADFLTFCDPYPYHGEVKGGYVWVTASKIIVTSNFMPYHIFPRCVELLRRINYYYEFYEKYVYSDQNPKFKIKDAL